MKKITILLVAAVTGLPGTSGFAQGAINFVNNGTSLVILYGNPVPLTSSSGIKIELFYQPDPAGSTAPTPISGLSTLGSWEAISTLADIAPLAGRFYGGGVTTGNDIAPAANVRCEIAGFNGNQTSLQNALAGGSTLFAFSGVWSQGTGDGGSIAAVSIEPGFTGLDLSIPEPSTIVLGGLGAAALLAFRRRK